MKKELVCLRFRETVLRFVTVAGIGLACHLFAVRLMADGGIVRVREAQGPFIVTVFSPAEVAVNIPTDVTVLVQKSGTDEIVMDATVDVSLIAPASLKIRPGDPFCSAPGGLPSMGMGVSGPSGTFRATRAHATNKLLYGLPIVLHAPGDWQLRTSVWRDGQSVAVTCALPVQITSSRISGLWFYLALAPCFIALFVLNQWLRRQAATALLRAV